MSLAPTRVATPPAAPATPTFELPQPVLLQRATQAYRDLSGATAPDGVRAAVPATVIDARVATEAALRTEAVVGRQGSSALASTASSSTSLSAGKASASTSTSASIGSETAPTDAASTTNRNPDTLAPETRGLAGSNRPQGASGAPAETPANVFEPTATSTARSIASPDPPAADAVSPRPSAAAELASIGTDSTASLERGDTTAATRSESRATAADHARTQLVRGMMEQIRGRFVPGRQEIRIQLRPLELGHVDLRVEMQPDGVRIRVDAVEPETRRLLERHLPELRETLSRSGVDVDDVRIAEASETRSDRDPGATSHPDGDRDRRAQTQPQYTGSRHGRSREFSLEDASTTPGDRKDTHGPETEGEATNGAPDGRSLNLIV